MSTMMKQVLPTRALITLDRSGVDLRGTYHKPADRLAETDLRASASGRTGVVFVNGLSAPRSGYGDTAVYWAESFAACGYPSFRIDLPGLGDTCGEIPLELLDFITRGEYASVIVTTVRELVDRFNLAGVVMVGNCAGAVTAVCAASEQNTCKGLIVMDPYFNFAKRITARVPGKLVSWSRKTVAGRVLRHVYDLARDLPRAIQKDKLPPSANRALLDRWKRAASRGMPILVLRSPGKEPGPGQFDYMKHAAALAGRKAKVEIKLLADADHSFAELAGRDAVRSHAEAWLRDFFPQPQ